MKEVIETVELCSTQCKHPECVYRSTIDGGCTPICFYAVLAQEPRGCRISECDRYKDGRKIRPRMKDDFIIWWETELYGEDADGLW